MPTELLQRFLLLQGVRILSPQGKVLWSNFAEFVKNCWGGITHSLRSTAVVPFSTLDFPAWKSHLTGVRNDSVGLGFPGTQLREGPHMAEPSHRPALPPSQQNPRAQGKHTDLQLLQRGLTLTMVLLCRGQELAQDSGNLLSDFWCYNTDLIYHKCKHCSQDLGRNQSSDFKYP